MFNVTYNERLNERSIIVKYKVDNKLNEIEIENSEIEADKKVKTYIKQNQIQFRNYIKKIVEYQYKEKYVFIKITYFISLY